MNGNIYRGNQNLKKSGISIEWTEDLILELKKCSEDPIHFIANYCKIVTLDHGLKLFEPFEYQKRMVDAFQNNRFVVNLLPRQMGKSTIVAAYILWYACFNRNKFIGLLANKAAVSREILSRIQRMYENLPFWLQPGLKEWNKGTISLENGTTIMAAATSSDSIRGFSLNLLYLDEFAHVEQQSAFWESTYPVISAGEYSKVIITSTPNGIDLFYRIFSDAEKGKNNFKAVNVHWSEHPKRDEKWKEETLKNIGLLQFDQEFGCEFQGSSGTLISGEILKSLEIQIPINYSQNQRQYVAPDKTRQYSIIADVSRGKGLDYSAFHVIDITTIPYNQVFVFRSNLITPTDYATYIQHIGILYNNAHILCEINDIGQQVIDIIHDSGYENIIYTKNNGRSGKIASQGFGSGVDMGVRTTTSVKALGCSSLKLLVEQFKLIINDENTIKELNTFSRKSKSWEAETGNNDDLVMGLVLFAWLTLQPFFKELTDTDILSSFREKTEQQLMDEMLPFGYILDGNEETVVNENFQTVDVFLKL